MGSSILWLGVITVPRLGLVGLAQLQHHLATGEQE